VGVTTCPTNLVNAPVERVWALLENPLRYAEWWDARTIQAEPPSPAHPGQVIRGGIRAAGLTFYLLTVIVRAVDADKHQIEFQSNFPLGIIGHNRIACVALDPTRCRVSYG
jgi:uncharacterized protein YndB with AHSA1/START domain